MATLIKDIPLWSKWNEHALRKKRAEITPREFDRGWRQLAISDEERLFRPDCLEECKSREATYYFPGSNIDHLKEIKSYKFFMGVDLAIAGKDSAGDFFVITVIMLQEKRKYHRQVISIFRERGLTFDEQIRKVEKFADFFEPSLIFVENNAYQQAFVQELLRQTPLPVKGFTTTAIKKSDMDAGLPRLSVEFENLRWTLPYEKERDRDLTDTLVKELEYYPIGRHDDMLMSLWLARNAAADIEKMGEKRVIIM